MLLIIHIIFLATETNLTKIKLFEQGAVWIYLAFSGVILDFFLQVCIFLILCLKQYIKSLFVIINLNCFLCCTHNAEGKILAL